MKMMKGLVLSLVLLPLLAFGQQQPPEGDLFTRNNDIRSLARMINTIVLEINNSASTQTLGVTADDITRWQQYNDSLRVYSAWVVAQPAPLDMPRTWHLVTEVAPAPDVQPTSNYTADDLVTWYILERFELINGQSSGRSSGLIDYDYTRFLKVLDRIDSRIALAQTGLIIDAPQTLSDLTGSATAASRGLSVP